MKFVPTVNKADVPTLFQEPHVDKGYRLLHQPWSNYLLSLFQWHNEVMNIWTHLLALFMVLIRGGLWLTEFDVLNDPYMWPLGVWFVGAIALFVCSSGAHLFHNRSELAHNVCFMIDYAGIGIFGFGSTVLQYWYCGHEDFLGSYWHQLAIPIGAVFGVNSCYCCVYSKIAYTRPYPYLRRVWQIGSVACVYIWCSLSIWVKIAIYAYEGRWQPNFGAHIQQPLWFMLGGFFFGSFIPERFFPGKFDFIGHSHQIFHLCIMMTTSKQMDGVYYDITHGMETLRQTQAPTFLITWGFLIIVISSCLLIVYFSYKSVTEDMLIVSGKEISNGHVCERHFETKLSNGTTDLRKLSRRSTNGNLKHRNVGSSSQNGDI